MEWIDSENHQVGFRNARPSRMIYFQTVMNSQILRLAFCLLSCISVTCLEAAAKAPSDPNKLFIGRVPYSSPGMVLIAHEALARYLQKTLKLSDVEFKLYLDYEQVYGALRREEIHLAWLGSVFFAKQKEWSHPLVCPKWSGRSSYRGQILVREDSQINQFQDLEGKRFAFVSRTSSSGYVFPLALLRSKGIDTDSFSEFAFLDKHSTVVYSILAKQFDAGAAYDGVLKEESLRQHSKKFKVLGKTAFIHNEPIVIHPKYRDMWAESIQTALVHFNVNNDSSSPKKIPNLTGFQKVTKENYEALRQMVRYVK